MYYLWLLPQFDQYDTLAELIIQLGQEFGGPSFPPHITLLSRLEGDKKLLIKKTTELATKIDTFMVYVDSIDKQDAYYKSLYLKLIQSKHILNARRQAEAQFNLSPEESYIPHVSLLYGNQSKSVKQKIIAHMKSQISKELFINRLQLIFADGPPETWKMISTEYLR